LNVISNAIESYGNRRGRKERPVIIRLERVRSKLSISVTDHGKPISPRHIDKIFEPFYTTKPNGIGIGLFIVKQVVENDFDGSISLDSDKRSGTTFNIRLPKSYYAKGSRR
jgi:signal transduction histidine kinase